MRYAPKRPNSVCGSILSAAHNLTVERLISPNEKKRQSDLTHHCCSSSCFGITGCKKHEVKMTEKNNGLYDYEEVRQINETLRMPYPLGTREAAFGSEFESYGGIPDHAEIFRSKDNLDITYTLSTLELKYGEPDKNTELIATGFTIRAANKTIIRNADGSTTPLYTTDRAVLGISVGNSIDKAKEKLLDAGYEQIYEETPVDDGLPHSREFSFRKGIVIVSFAVETENDISSIRVWIPYRDKDIDALNKKSHLPADLGLFYSVMINPNFKYSGKNTTSRRYESEDGCVAIMRGFPDVKDAAMTAEVSFTSTEYDALGVKVGMTLDEAENILTEAGCTKDSDGLYVFGNVAAIRLTVENGTVARIAATLRPSTNLTDTAVSGDEAAPSPVLDENARKAND